MLNIFNLFLSLFAWWALFMIAAGKTSMLYIIFGIISAALVSIVSSRFKMIEKKSELLYLSFGFYRHFIKIFIGNFFSSLRLVISIILIREPLYPTIHKIKIDSNIGFNPALLVASINMTTGLFSIESKKGEITIHAISQEYFESFNLTKTCKSLRNVNDDDIV